MKNDSKHNNNIKMYINVRFNNLCFVFNVPNTTLRNFNF